MRLRGFAIFRFSIERTYSSDALHAASLHLGLELACIGDTREKVRLATCIVAIKGREPFAPLLLGGLGLFEVDDHGEIQARKERVVCDGVVIPLVDRTGDIVVRLLDQRGSLLKIKSRAFKVVKLKVVLLEDQADTSCLYPQKGCKKKVEKPTAYANQRERSVAVVCCKYKGNWQ
jgi:hypothetical protein